jgi:hypothetical protein
MGKSHDIKDEIRIKSIDGDELFGSENADLEHESLFDSYSLDRDDFSKLYDTKRKIAILFSYKGSGKSAALRLIRNRHKDSVDSVVALMSAGEITPTTQSNDVAAWTSAWKQSILKQLAAEVGTRISSAYDDDATTLVQYAEREGFKRVNFVGYVTKHLSEKYQLTKQADLDSGVSKKIQRFLNSKQILVWLLIDDVDSNFKADPNAKAKIVGFISAIKLLTSQIPELRTRFTIRPNVWELLAKDFDSINQMREFQIPIEWVEKDIMQLLAKRISSYYHRSESNMAGSLDEDGDHREWIGLVFEDQMRWSGSTRPPHVVLDTLSRNRPRWLIELAKLSLKSAKTNGHLRITLDDVNERLEEFGRARITDSIAEFGSQCSQLEQLISCFREQEKTYRQDQLISLINNNILTHINPQIVGVPTKPDAKDIIRFLYFIGFLSARKDRENGSYEHIPYADNPTFLATVFDVRNSFTWEIHPVFAVALQMRSERPISGLGAKGSNRR